MKEIMQMLPSSRLAVASLLLVAVATPAPAAPIQWTAAMGGNDHWYEFDQGAPGGVGVSWAAAREAALGRSHLGLQGYLATITTAAEQAFVAGRFTGGWLGGTDALVEGEWRWADGPEAGLLFWLGGIAGRATGYANWDPRFGGEPNNNGNEDALQMIVGGGWNDYAANAPFIIEYGTAPLAAVPIPGTLTLSLLALVLAAAAGGRRRPAP